MKHLLALIVCILACAAVIAMFVHRRAVQPQILDGTVVARSRLSNGDLSRLQRILAKARRGEPVTVGVIGGSIARGQQATAPDRQFADRVARWWVDRFPESKITLVNAGVAGTGSNYGCLRVQRDLLSRHPDFVIVEFGVNDPDKPDKPQEAQSHADTYEGVVRQLLEDPDQPAVLLLFLMHHDGTNAQRLQSEIGRHYGLPMISYRDALWPEIAAGRMQLGDVFFDTVHPNDRGHEAIATFINSLLQDTLDHLPTDAAIPPISRALPPPRFTDLFVHTAILNAVDLKPIYCDGWNYDPTSKSWRSNHPGSSIEFDIPGQVVDLLYTKMDGGFGKIQVTVDGGDPLVFDSWLNGSWGPLCQMDQLVSYPGTTRHHIRIELLAEKNPLSSGNEFQILGFGTAGAAK